MIVSDASPLIYLAKAGSEREFYGIHKGETNTILLAKKYKCLVLIDEEDAREVARALGLSVRGSLYVLKMAVEKDLLSENDAIKTLDEMIDSDFRISTIIYAKFLDYLKK